MGRTPGGAHPPDEQQLVERLAKGLELIGQAQALERQGQDPQAVLGHSTHQMYVTFEKLLRELAHRLYPDGPRNA